MPGRRPAPQLRVLHLHSTFDRGGKETRAVQLMNAFGPRVAHSIVSGQPEALGAAALIDPAIPVEFPRDFPALNGKPFPRRLHQLAQAMQGFDLVLSYNWGAMDAVLAHTAFRQVLNLPPLVHHEDGFNQDEAVKLKASRNLFRRIALHRVDALVVPSQRLEDIARNVWHQPAARIKRIPNGIPVFAYGGKANRDALPRVVKHRGELWLGTLAGLRPVKNLPRLVRAFAPLPEEWQLVILGEGPEREAIRAEAIRLGIGHRVHLPGHVDHPVRAMGLFDLFALSSDSEQFPISIVEAMAAGLAVAAPRVGDVAAMVAAENVPLLCAPGDEAGLSNALQRLASDATLRAALGRANRARAEAEYDEATMISAYARLYAGVLGRPGFP